MSGDDASAFDDDIESSSMRLFDDRYRLVRRLAKVTSGGYVYAAEHALTRKPCAVKLLHRRAPELVRKRIAREIDALAITQGKGIVDFIDAGEAEGHLYMVFELLSGRTLAGLLAAKGRLEIAHAIAYASQLAAALAHCHALGVVHRDVKPANIFVMADHSLRLIDFGIAKIADPERKLELVTQENSLLGTPEYMAPEALLASPDADHRVDQYGFGVVLYECLTGVVPFDGAYGEILRKVTTTPIKPARELRSEIPAALADVLARALARNPDERFPDMAALCHAMNTLPPVEPARVYENARDAIERSSPTVADAPIAKVRNESHRRHPRASYMTLAQLRVGEHDVYDGRIEQISVSGFQFVGQRPVSVGTRGVVRFALPMSGRVVEAPAIARWSHSTRALQVSGFEITESRNEMVADIHKYVSLMSGASP